MITDAEKTELRHLLNFLSTDEIVSLKDTVTNKLLETTSKEEGIEAILAHSVSAFELLYRKKLNRGCIFQYLANKKVDVSVSTSKQDLAGMVLYILQGVDYLNDRNPCSNEAIKTKGAVMESPSKKKKEKQGQNEASKVKRKLPDSSNKEKQGQNEASKVRKKLPDSSNKEKQGQNEASKVKRKLPDSSNKEKPSQEKASKVKRKLPDSSNEGNRCSNEATKTQDAVMESPSKKKKEKQGQNEAYKVKRKLPDSSNKEKQGQNEASKVKRKLPDSSNKEKQGKNEAAKVKGKVSDSSNEGNRNDNEATKTQVTVTELPTFQQQVLAVQFSKWFYALLNSYNPCQAKSPLESWGPHHFWSDCQLVINICLIDEDRKETFEGADVVSERLLSMAKDELLLFNPNLGEFGTKGKMNKHGVTMVLVCGTLHRKSECLGTFEQCFALISDPTFQNNWKVKFTNLSIMRKDVKSTPRLKDASLLALTAE
ncbi:uncharacterized protein C3orf38 homolog isoform X2 [Anneissia japonica]|uniref:uncharacterized protein C3orf38 homolog isoform X2 n=1 Tax=Anneissia japonica TaxID=1529436 RepID=UPI001425ACF2|nr:uncharacterized protein C3orf38 homolog isoform X2 [Anneissia japonica]